MPHGAACTHYPARTKFRFARETPMIIDIINRHFLELVMAREGGKEKAEMIKREKITHAHDPKWNTITQFVIIYTRVPDMLVENFAGT